MKIPLPVSIGLQLGVSYLVAAVVAIRLADGAGWLWAVIGAVLVGLAMTATLQRSLWLLDAAVRQIRPMPTRWHGVLSPLVERLNRLLAQAGDVSDLRKNLIRRVQDTAAQQERNRLARDLHDSIKQQLFSINMSTAAAQARWTHDPNGAQTALNDVRRSAQEAMVEMNALLQQLAPAPLEKQGLVQALREQCEALGYRSGAEVIAEFGELPEADRLPAGTEQSVFRIVQEALSNIARHARAHQVRVYLGRTEAALVLEITDDGQGFDAKTAETGMGLTNLRQRVMELHGTLDITSAQGKGTHLRAAIPLVEQVQSQEEAMNVPMNHTLNKVCLVGLVGGLTLIAVMYYPLYVLLPSNYLAEWQGGSGLLGIVLQAMAAVIAVGMGYAAARWGQADSRRSGVIFGALAGGIAGVVLYVGLAGAAAGVVGSSAVIRHGLVPAANNDDFLHVLGSSVLGIVWWTYSVLWGALIAGISLGAIGGLLAPLTKTPLSWKAIRFGLVIPLNVAILAAGCNLFLMYMAYSLLEPSTSKLFDSVVTVGLSGPEQPISGISILPMVTALIIHVAVLIARFAVLRTEMRGEYTQILFTRPLGTGIGYTMTALVMPVTVLIAGSQSVISQNLRLLLWVGVGLCLVLSLLFLRLMLRLRQEKQAAKVLPPITRQTVISVAATIVGVAAILVVGTVFGAGLLFTGLLSTLVNQPVIPTVVLVISIVLLMQFVRTRKHVLIAGISIPGEAYAQSGAIGLQAHLGSIITSTTLGALILLSGVSAPLTLVMILVSAIVPLSDFEHVYAPQQTMTQLLQSNYLVHLGGLVYVFIVVAMCFGLLTLLAWGVLRLRWNRRPPTSGSTALATEG